VSTAEKILRSPPPMPRARSRKFAKFAAQRTRAREARPCRVERAESGGILGGDEGALRKLGPAVAALALPGDGGEVDRLVGNLDEAGDRGLGPRGWREDVGVAHWASGEKGGDSDMRCPGE
jgi:hypothetical protein